MLFFEKLKHLFISKEEVIARDTKLAQEVEKVLEDEVRAVDKLLDSKAISDRYQMLVVEHMSADKLQEVVENNLIEELIAIKGIGKKTAEKILKELK